MIATNARHAAMTKPCFGIIRSDTIARIAPMPASTCPRRPDAIASRDQPESEAEASAVKNEHRETRLAEAVDEAQPKDRVILPRVTIGEPAAEQREKVNANDEGVKDVLRCVLAIRFRQINEQRRDE